MNQLATHLGGSYSFPGTRLSVRRLGYGAMQLAGPGVFGPPKDEQQAIAVLREAIESGINHIDTSDFYGPHVTNQIIKKALHPYAKELVIVSKVGAKRGSDASWNKALSREDITTAVHDNLKNLGLEAIDIVNLRVGGFAEPVEGPIEEPLSYLIELKKQGLVKHIGISTVTQNQFEQASKLTDVVCVQNMYNVAKRGDDKFIDYLATKGVPYVPYFPLGGFEPLQSKELDQLAKEAGVTQMQLALAWLLKRSPNMVLIPGTSSLAHLRENIRAAAIDISDDLMSKLNNIGSEEQK